MHHKHFENLWDHLSLDMPHTLSPFKALCETNLCFRKQLILKNSLLFLENVSFPQSIHRTFTQPWVFSLILPPHRKATSFFVLLICFNQVAQWYKTQIKEDECCLFTLVVFWSSLDFCFLLPRLGLCVWHILRLALWCLLCTASHGATRGASLARSTLPSRRCRAPGGV